MASVIRRFSTVLTASLTVLGFTQGMALAQNNPPPTQEVSGEAGGSIYVTTEAGTEIHQPFLVGFNDGLFHPEAAFTRAEAAAVVARLKDLPPPTQSAPTYSDVNTGNWAYRYIESVTKAGYMKGYGDGTFHPNRPISRAELTVLMLAVRGIPTQPILGFSDTNNHWAKDAIGTAKSLGLVSGRGDNLFYPDAPTQRQEAAKMVDEAFLRGPLQDGDIAVVQHFPDVSKSSWAFGWVEEAAKVAHEAVRTPTGEKLVRYLPDQTHIQ